MNIGTRIKSARESMGITQEDLGRKCGTTKQTIFKYENNIVTNIPMTRLKDIAFALKVSPAYLMGWENENGDTDLGLVAIDIAKECGYNAIDVMNIMNSMHLTTPIDKYTIISEIKKRKPTPVSENGPVDPLDVKLTDLLHRATPEQKKAWIALLENMQLEK